MLWGSFRTFRGGAWVPLFRIIWKAGFQVFEISIVCSCVHGELIYMYPENTQKWNRFLTFALVENEARPYTLLQ